MADQLDLLSVPRCHHQSSKLWGLWRQHLLSIFALKTMAFVKVSIANSCNFIPSMERDQMWFMLCNLETPNITKIPTSGTSNKKTHPSITKNAYFRNIQQKYQPLTDILGFWHEHRYVLVDLKQYYMISWERKNFTFPFFSSYIM